MILQDLQDKSVDHLQDTFRHSTSFTDCIIDRLFSTNLWQQATNTTMSVVQNFMFLCVRQPSDPNGSCRWHKQNGPKRWTGPTESKGLSDAGFLLRRGLVQLSDQRTCERIEALKERFEVLGLVQSMATRIPLPTFPFKRYAER